MDDARLAALATFYRIFGEVRPSSEIILCSRPLKQRRPFALPRSSVDS
jgi:hypothetical protein